MGNAKSGDLVFGTQTFNQQSHQAYKKTWWKNTKFHIVAASAILLIILIAWVKSSSQPVDSLSGGSSDAKTPELSDVPPELNKHVSGINVEDDDDLEEGDYEDREDNYDGDDDDDDVKTEYIGNDALDEGYDDVDEDDDDYNDDIAYEDTNDDEDRKK